MFNELFTRLKHSTLFKTSVLLLIWKCLLYEVFFLLIIHVVPLKDRFASQQFGTGVADEIRMWANFDGFQYLRVARSGYNLDNLPFFPFFPATILFARIVLDVRFLFAGILVAYLAFFGCLRMFYLLLTQDKKVSSWVTFICLLFIYPTAFYYGAVYNDSLFLLFSLLCIYFARRREWVFASTAGIFATATRLNGLALAIFVAVEFISSLYEEDWDDWQITTYFKHIISKETWMNVWRSGAWTVIFIPGTYLTYLYYIQTYFGDWRMIHRAMVVWGQEKVVFPPIIFIRYLRIFLTVKVFSVLYLVAAMEFGAVMLYLFICWYSWKKIRFSYWVLMVVSFIIPSLTGTFAGMPRYALHLYPFFLGVLLLWEKMPRFWRIVFVTACIILQTIVFSLFTRGYFVS